MMNSFLQDIERFESYVLAAEECVRAGELEKAQVYALLAVALSGVIDPQHMRTVRKTAADRPVPPPTVSDGPETIRVPDPRSATGHRVIMPPNKEVSDRIKKQFGLDS